MEQSPVAENTSLADMSEEANISMKEYLRGYRANLHARFLAVGVACLLGGGAVVGVTASSAQSAESPVACPNAAQLSRPVCQPRHQETEPTNKTAVAEILGLCLTGTGALLCVVAGSPESDAASRRH